MKTKPKSAPPREEVCITVRFPAALHAQITEAARVDRRSLNTWILMQLEQALQKETDR